MEPANLSPIFCERVILAIQDIIELCVNDRHIAHILRLFLFAGLKYSVSCDIMDWLHVSYYPASTLSIFLDTAPVGQISLQHNVPRPSLEFRYLHPPIKTLGSLFQYIFRVETLGDQNPSNFPISFLDLPIQIARGKLQRSRGFISIASANDRGTNGSR